MDGSMQTIEALVTEAFNPTSQARAQAIQRLESLVTGADASTTLLTIIAQSQIPSAVLYAAGAMTHIYTNFFNTFSLQARREIRAHLANTLVQRAEFLCTAGNETVRSKMAGTDADADSIAEDMLDEQRAPQGVSQRADDPLLSEVAHKMVAQTQSLAHILIGCGALYALVRDMSQHLSHFSGAKQRKIAVSFRDKSLLDVLGDGFSTLGMVRASNITLAQANASPIGHILRSVIDLINAVFNFDFIGTIPDDSSDDASIIHVPASWSTMIENTPTTQMLFELYHQLDAPVSSSILEVLVNLVSVRNSLFKSSETRATFLACIFAGVGKILETKKGTDLMIGDNRHQICRLLVRLKANFQLTHLVKVDSYKSFIQLVASFHIQVFESDALENSIYYVLHFWNRMVSATTYLQQEDTAATMLDIISPQMLVGFIKGQIQAEAGLSPGDESLLDDKQLGVLLETIPKLAHQGDYRMVAQYLLGGLDSLKKSFMDYMLPNPSAQLCILEKQLAWVIHVITAVMFARLATSQDEVDNNDAQLICSAFDVLKISDQRVNQFGPTTATPYLEAAFVGFLRKFSRIYFTDPSMERTPVHQMLAERHGLTSPAQIIDAVLSKIGMNLKMWGQTEYQTDVEVSGDSLDLFQSLATGRASANLLTKSSLIAQIIAKHNELSLGNSMRTRFVFYSTLSKLIFPTADYEQFDNFVQPFDQKLLMVSEAFRTGAISEGLGNGVVEVLTDLRGVLSSCCGQKGYEMFFDWFYLVHNYFGSVVVPTIQSMANRHWKSVWAALKFADELTTNRHRRIQFPNTSADGLRLFRDTANVLLFVGQTILAINPPTAGQDTTEIDNKLKGIRHYLKLFADLLTGEYANLGVFQLYNDPILVQLLTMTFTLIFSLDIHQMRVYPKTAEALYVALDMISVHDVSLLYQAATQQLTIPGPNGNAPIMMQLLLLLHHGIRASRLKIICCSATALDKIVTHQLEKLFRRRNSPPALLLDGSHTNILSLIMFDLFDVLLNDRENIHWSLCKPLVALILLLPDAFQQLQDMMIKSQALVSEEKARALAEQFTKLTTGVERNLKTENREKFVSNCTTFRTEVKEFLDFNAMYKAMPAFLE